MWLFSLSTFWVTLLLVAVIGGFTALGVVLGRRARSRPAANVEPVGVVQGTLLGLVGLLLAFGLTMAVGRYEARRALVLDHLATEQARHRAAARGRLTIERDLEDVAALADPALAEPADAGGGVHESPTALPEGEMQLSRNRPPGPDGRRGTTI